jgi:hypothetical protein
VGAAATNVRTYLAGVGSLSPVELRLVLAIGVLMVGACSTQGSKGAVPAPRTTTTVATTTTTVATTTTTIPTTTTTSIGPAPAVPLAYGRWSPVGLVVNGVPTLTATTIPSGGALIGVAKINHAVTHPVLYAGSLEPGGTWPYQTAVAAVDQPKLVAAFNSGFHTGGSGGGWFDHGRTAVALRPGAASLVIAANGSATVGSWGRDASLTPDVVSVRQNLTLLVDGGANLGPSSYWGATLGGARYVWRSGVGVDAAGDLLFAGGPSLDGTSLADVMIKAGAVRAMELDINPQWVSFCYYTGGGAGNVLLPGMNFGPGHWLSGSSRDFFAVFLR